MKKERLHFLTKIYGLQAYGIILYFLLFATCSCFVFFIHEFDFQTVLFLLAAIPAYTFFYMLPAISVTALTILVVLCFKEKPIHRIIVFSIAIATGFLTQMLLLSDLGLYRNFDFHFNPLVWNLLTTPGGFESMGLRVGTLLLLSILILVLLAFHIALAICCQKHKRFQQITPFLLKNKRKYVWAGTFVLLFAFVSFFYGYEHFMLQPNVLEAADRIPLFRTVTMKSFLKSLKIKPPEESKIIDISTNDIENLHYPITSIIRDPQREKYNILWLTAETFRADALTPEVMPNAWKFAQEGIRFTHHYSGGNGTRVGIFSMFYSLYGSYWHEFLKRNCGCLFIDWLIEDHYQIECITSAKFSYPEFDQTVFARVAATDMISDSEGRTWQRDRRNTKRMTDFLNKTESDKPFFAFFFFESPHAPYEFPPESIIYPDYAKTLNYVTITPELGPAIKKRYLNACHHLDQRLGDIFKVLKEKDLLKNTIVVLTGDHGEEFFENGHLGHNSAFVEQQIHTPLVLRIPGEKPRTYNSMSSHIDIVPMLAPYLGVQNPASDFALGINLLTPGVKRDYTIVADWSRIAFVSSDYKTILPSNIKGFATQKLTDGQDKPRSDKQAFYQKNNTR
ncbi:MAG: sulfatase-like hydrolase/transferase, partial [Lentisphaeria bacterium]